MSMGVCQWLVIASWVFQLLAGMVMDGKPRLSRDGNPEKYHLESNIANVAISFIILYFGGFFK